MMMTINYNDNYRLCPVNLTNYMVFFSPEFDTFGQDSIHLYKIWFDWSKCDMVGDLIHLVKI